MRTEEGEATSPPFTRSLRSLDTERSPLSTLALVVDTALLGLWSFWFFFVEVRIYEATDGARLEVSRTLHRVQSQVAARRLGIHRDYLYRMIVSLELKEELEG